MVFGSGFALCGTKSGLHPDNNLYSIRIQISLIGIKKSCHLALECVESGSEAGCTERGWREEPEEVYEG